MNDILSNNNDNNDNNGVIDDVSVQLSKRISHFSFLGFRIIGEAPVV